MYFSVEQDVSFCVHDVAACVGNTYKLRADSHTKAIEWCRSLDVASRISSADQVCVSCE